MNFSIKTTPFTAREAYLSIIQERNEVGGGIWIKSLIRPEWGKGRKKTSNLLVKITPISKDGRFLVYDTIATPQVLKIVTEDAYIQIYFKQYNQISIECKGISVCYEIGHDDNQAVNQVCNVDSYQSFFPLLNQDIKLIQNNGSLTYDVSQRRIFAHSNDTVTNTIFEFWPRDLEKPQNFTTYETIENVERDFLNFISHYQYSTEIELLALYHLWSIEYVSCGHFTRNMVAISKNNMNLAWSWDHLFIALAIAKSNLKLAWDSIMLFLEHQKENGMIIDAMNPVTIVDWFTKPPVYGFFLRKFIENGYPIPKDDQKFIYNAIKKNTEWWLNLDDFELVGYQKPFDSGWDNATCFDRPGVVYTPDINTYLIIQMQFLSELASDLGFDNDSIVWSSKSKKLLNSMITKLWNDDQFVCMDQSNNVFETQSLIRMIPLMLGSLLPKEISTKMIREIKMEDHYLTPRGIATESVRSKLYDTRKGDISKPNAYWRGPMWSPPIYFINQGLIELNEVEFANIIAERYTLSIEKSKAFFEDYDALLDIGYDDFGYGWTAAVYTLFKKL